MVAPLLGPSPEQGRGKGKPVALTPPRDEDLREVRSRIQVEGDLVLESGRPSSFTVSAYGRDWEVLVEAPVHRDTGFPAVRARVLADCEPADRHSWRILDKKPYRTLGMVRRFDGFEMVPSVLEWCERCGVELVTFYYERPYGPSTREVYCLMRVPVRALGEGRNPRCKPR